MKMKFVGSTIVFFILVMGIITGFQVLPSIDELKPSQADEIHVIVAEDIDIQNQFEPEIEKLFRITTESNDVNIYHIYITVYPSDGVGTVDFSEVNKTVDRTDEYLLDQEDPYANIFYSDEKVESKGLINATIELRGQSARLADQKSYKIKILDDDSLWFGDKTINLNKHYYDSVRMRNKLSFDLFMGLDNIVSLETRFVELHVKDLSLEDESYHSYGLFTSVEQPGKDFLDKYFNDRYGLLYKAEYFEFYNYDAIQSRDSVTFDQRAFENNLEVKGAEEHENIKEMLGAVNDYNLDINETIDTYFHEENMLTWMAFNILVSNFDSNSRNYLLYSSINKEKWYFIPWDYDGAWQYKYMNGRWERGLSNYWGVTLFNRYMKKEGNLEKIVAKVVEVKAYLNKSRIQSHLDVYREIVRKYLFVLPDFENTTVLAEEFDDKINALTTLPQENYEYFMTHLEDPMPFHYSDEIITDQTVEFIWDAAYDLQDDKVTYEFILGSDPELKNIIYNKDNILSANIVIDRLPKGIYYWKVVATDTKGNWQTSFSYYRYNRSTRVFGVRELVME